MTVAALDRARPSQMSLRLSDLDLEESKKYWPRIGGLDTERVETYKDVLCNPDGGMYALPPILVVPHPGHSGKYIVADGMHRVEAHRLLVKEGLGGFASIDAKVYSLGTDPYLLAMYAFGTGTLPLKDTEKGPNIDRLLREHKEMSTREIARVAGASQTYVMKRKKALEGDSTPEKVNTVFSPAPKVNTVFTTDEDEGDDEEEEDRPGWRFMDAIDDLRNDTMAAPLFFGKGKPSVEKTARELAEALNEAEIDDAREWAGILEHFSDASRLAVKLWTQE